MAIYRMMRRVVWCGFLALSCTACFEVDEWVRIADNGATTMRATVRMAIGDGKSTPHLNTHNPLSESVAAIPGITVSASIAEQRNGQMLAATELAGASLANFQNIYRKLPAADSADESTRNMINMFRNGGFYHAHKAHGRIRVERTITPQKSAHKKMAKKSGKKSKNDLAAFGDDMSNMLLGSVFLRFALSLPGDILASNAETIDGHTAHWVFPLPYLAKTKITLWAEVADTPAAERALLGVRE